MQEPGDDEYGKRVLWVVKTIDDGQKTIPVFSTHLQGGQVG